jgi:hypothetical protein
MAKQCAWRAPSDDTFDPFHAPAGKELDAHIHYRILKQALTPECPRYSTDSEAAEILRRYIESAFGVRVVSGRTSTSKLPWFARYEIDQGNPTEVLGDTYPVVICRLAILRANRV